jgi:hypothetical protein
MFVLTLMASLAYGQSGKRYMDYLPKESNPVALKYADPYYPSEGIVPGVKNDKMEEYAKLHPHIPVKPASADATFSQQQLEQAQAEWIQQNPYYPQFVPYHLYNYLLTPDDDVAIYEAALAAWKRANPDKAAEIEAANVR